MFNSNGLTGAEPPSTLQLLRSTVLALLAAIVILVTIVLPSEYGIDPTGVGQILGLKEMGEIKTQLAEEAEADQQQAPIAAPSAAPAPTSPAAIPAPKAPAAKPVPAAPAVKTAPAAAPRPAPPVAVWKDEMTFTLKPGQGAEIKLIMKKGAVAEFDWVVQGGVANYDLHGDGGGKSITYKKGRDVPGHKGELTADFTGNHGWFWRNRDKQDITIILRARGDYSEMKRVI